MGSGPRRLRSQDPEGWGGIAYGASAVWFAVSMVFAVSAAASIPTFGVHAVGGLVMASGGVLISWLLALIACRHSKPARRLLLIESPFALAVVALFCVAWLSR